MTFKKDINDVNQDDHLNIYCINNIRFIDFVLKDWNKRIKKYI